MLRCRADPNDILLDGSKLNHFLNHFRFLGSFYDHLVLTWCKIVGWIENFDAICILISFLYALFSSLLPLFRKKQSASFVYGALAHLGSSRGGFLPEVMQKKVICVYIHSGWHFYALTDRSPHWRPVWSDPPPQIPVSKSKVKVAVWSWKFACM